jgi:hypothetical protein
MAATQPNADSALLFPRILYGTAKEVDRAWWRLTRAAWKLGTWEPVVANLEMLSVNERPGCILLAEGGLLGKQDHWRLYFVPYLLTRLALRQSAKEKPPLHPDPLAQRIYHNMSAPHSSATGPL